MLRCVAVFLCKVEWINETALNWKELAQVLEKNLPIIGWKIFVIIVQSGLKLSDLTTVAARVEMNIFVIRSRNIAEARNINLKFAILLFWRKPQNAVALSLEAADGMVKTTLRQLGKPFNLFYMASDLYLNIMWSRTNTELHYVQVNQCQFCVVHGIAKMCRSLW